MIFPAARRTAASPVRLIALDLDGTLLQSTGGISPRNQAALRATRDAGAEIVIATGRRHSYAMRQLRSLDLPVESLLISSNGAVTRTLSARLLHRAHMARSASERLFAALGPFRNSLVVTFDCVGANGDDQRGALVVEHLEELHSSIGKWMAANEPSILHLQPIERCLTDLSAFGEPIQMMLCGPVARMREAEALLLRLPGVVPADTPDTSPATGAADSPGTAGTAEPHSTAAPDPEIALHRTEYPDRDLSIVDILPAGASKGSALRRLAATRGLPLSSLMAIGDNWNDLPMLGIAGHPVLMGNAPAELLALAAHRGWQVTSPNDQDGVAEAVEAALEVDLAAPLPAP